MNLSTGISTDIHQPPTLSGGFEWWQFECINKNEEIFISIKYLSSNLFSPYYQEKLKNYLLKTNSLSTQTQPEVPKPLHYPGVHIQLFQKGKCILDSYQEFETHSLKASDKTPAFLLGPQRFNWDDKSDLPSYVLTLQANDKNTQKLFRTRLFFTPVPLNINNTAPQNTSSYKWILAAPLCHVEGTLEFCNKDGSVNREIAFVGSGTHDHHQSNLPLYPLLKNWHWGWAYKANERLHYNCWNPAQTDSFSWPTSTVAFTDSQKNITIENTSHENSQTKRNFFWLDYEKKIIFSTSKGKIRLVHEKVLMDGPSYLIFKDSIEFLDSKEKWPGYSHFLKPSRLLNAFSLAYFKSKTTLVKLNRPVVPNLNKPNGDVFTSRPPLDL